MPQTMSDLKRNLGASKLGFLLLGFSLPLLAMPAQAVEDEASPGLESPSGYQRETDALDQTEAQETSNDAEAAEAEIVEKKGAAAADLTPAEGRRVEEIVVHARKREELLENTPVSVTALSEEMLKAANVTRLDQIQELVPNLSIFRTLSGQTASIVIRGVGNFPFIYYDQGVGLYVDGVYLSRNAGSVLDVVDVASVEVLRGPQGTLFGKNSIGGAVSLTTVKPKPELEGYVEISAGGFGTLDTRAVLNLPIAPEIFDDRLATRLSFASYKMAGYTRNEFNDKDSSDRNSQNFLGSIQYRPIDELTLDLSGTWSHSSTRGLGGQCRNVDFPAGGAPPTAPFVQIYYPGFEAACEASQPYNFQSEVSGLAEVDSAGTWGIATWDVGDLWVIEDVAVKSTSAWRQQTPSSQLDIDMTEFPIAVSNGFGDGSDPLQGQPSFQRQMQTELQLNGTTLDERVNFVGGLFAFWESANEDNGLSILPNTPVAPLGISYNYTTVSNWDWALFGQGTVDLTEWASFSAGTRYTQEKKGLSRLVLQPENAIVPVPVDFTGRAIYDAWTPMASLALTAPVEWLDPILLEHLMGYFTFSKGFRGGGFNGGARVDNPVDIAPFEPEYIDAYEIGFKTIALDRMLTTNLSIFYMDRTDQQVPQIVSNVCPPEQPDCIPPTSVLTRNAASSVSKGFELEATAMPIDALLIDGSVGYTDSRFGDFPDAQDPLTGAAINRRGERIPFTPLWQTHLGAQYSVEIPTPGPLWMRGWLTPRLDWSYRSEQVNWAEELTDLTQPGFGLLNARLSYVFNDNRSQVAFWAMNLCNKVYFQETVALPRITTVVTRYYEPPRTLGVEVSHSF